jgi:hypothetical protein
VSDDPANPTRREFLKSASAAATITALGPLVAGADVAREPMVGIQIGSVSLLDEGTEQVLDILQQRGKVNTLFVAAFTYGRGIAGRQVSGRPLPDHGRQEYDSGFHGGNFATPHAKFYERTTLRQTKAPDHGDYDVLADVIPKAHRRGMKVYAWYEDVFRTDIPGIENLREIDLEGHRAATLCTENPDYRRFLVGLTEDFCQSYELDGVMWGCERQGPLNNALGASHAGRGDPSRVTCFCELHQKAAKDRGIDVRRATEGFRKLADFVRASRSGKRSDDGYFVTFWRLLLNYPEILAWEKLWTDSQQSIYADIYNAARKSRPQAKVGFHIWHNNSFSPFYRAEQDYAQLAKVSDFLKIVLYNNCGGPRYAGAIRNMSSTFLHDLTPEMALEVNNSWLNYPSGKSLDQLSREGLPPDYVARETKRAIAGVGAKCEIYPGIDIDIPTAASEKQTTPDDVYSATLAALNAGAQGVIFSRKYSEMQLANLDAGGKAIRNWGANK